MVVEDNGNGKTIGTSYHPEEMVWQEDDHKLDSARRETLIDPWVQTCAEHESGAAESNPEQGQASSPYSVGAQPSEIAPKEKQIFEDTTGGNDVPVLDNFANDDFTETEKILDYFGWDGEISHVEDGLYPVDFDENAHHNPWDITPLEGDSELRRAKKKASIISGIILTKNPQEQHEAKKYLTDMFRYTYPYPATFRAFKDMATEDFSFDDLKNIVELRNIWSERSDWWMYRYHGEIVPIPRGHNALTWRLAKQIFLARRDFPIEYMIDESWREEWLHLESGTEGYFSFPDFIRIKIMTSNDE